MKNIVSGVNSTLSKQMTNWLLQRRALQCDCAGTESYQRSIRIVHGHMETVHAYTDDQNLHDNTHSKSGEAVVHR